MRPELPITTLSALQALRQRDTEGLQTKSRDLNTAPLRALLPRGYVEEYVERGCICVRLTGAGIEALELLSEPSSPPTREADRKLRKRVLTEDHAHELELLREQIRTLEARHARVLRAYLALREVRTLGNENAHTIALAKYHSTEQALKPNDLKAIE